jgi:hypothetical protein
MAPHDRRKSGVVSRLFGPSLPRRRRSMRGMDLDAHHDLTTKVLRLTWQSLQCEAEALHAEAPGLVVRPPLRRFHSAHTLVLVREAILSACHDAGADGEVAEFFSTHWLQRFAPRPV